MNLRKMYLFFVVAVFTQNMYGRKSSDKKMIEYHKVDDVDSTTQEVFEQFANAADTIMVISTHPKDKRLIIKKVAQMLADITKFIVEATRKVCLIEDMLQDEQQYLITKDLENDALTEEDLLKDKKKLVEVWLRVSNLVDSLSQ